MNKREIFPDFSLKHLMVFRCLRGGKYWRISRF